MHHSYIVIVHSRLKRFLHSNDREWRELCRAKKILSASSAHRQFIRENSYNIVGRFSTLNENYWIVIELVIDFTCYKRTNGQVFFKHISHNRITMKIDNLLPFVRFTFVMCELRLRKGTIESQRSVNVIDHSEMHSFDLSWISLNTSLFAYSFSWWPSIFCHFAYNHNEVSVLILCHSSSLNTGKDRMLWQLRKNYDVCCVTRDTVVVKNRSKPIIFEFHSLHDRNTR